MKVFLQKDYPQHIDDRGAISNILPLGETIQDVAYITGKKDAVRGNHYHIEDTHYCFVLEGTLRYEYKESEEGVLKEVVLHPGDMVYSPPGEYHRFVFESDGAFLALARLPRTEEDYEKHTIRKDF